MYRVIKSFADSKDDNHVYVVGNTFPREGVTATDERIAELASTENKLGVPVIKEVKKQRRKK